jgi:hypothetical protein
MMDWSWGVETGRSSKSHNRSSYRGPARKSGIS